jgi:hypothetical protein
VISLIFYLTYFFYFNFEQCVKTGLLKKLCLIFTFVELDMTYVLSSPFGDGLILVHVLTTRDALFVECSDVCRKKIIAHSTKIRFIECHPESSLVGFGIWMTTQLKD